MGLKTISVATIRENPVALRTVNKTSESYLGLVDSMRQKGFMGAITVRDSKNDPGAFELVDGLHRLSAAKDAGLTEINVDVVSFEDDMVLEAQIMANVHKVETRPVEYSKQLTTILARNPLMTESELATKLGMSPQWIQQRLGLTKIDSPEIQALIDEGKINLANAYALAKLPPEEQADFVDRAMTEHADQFIPVVNSRVKELRDAKRQGKDVAPKEFQPHPFLQTIKDIKDELSSQANAKKVLASEDATDAIGGYVAAIKWILHLDSNSIKIQQSKYEEAEAKKNEAKKIRDEAKAVKNAEKAESKAKEAAIAADKAKAELEGK